VLATIIEISDDLTGGDVIVGLGTLLLAVFTWRLARATYMLDERNAARERKRREREVRGVARVVLGEVEVVETSARQAVAEREWHWVYPIPHGAWDRDGALIAQAIAEDEASTLVRTFSKLTSWELVLSTVHEDDPALAGIEVGSEQAEVLADLLAEISDAKRSLHTLAYPDARDLEPDPDDFLAYRRARRRARWDRVLRRR
jgi:hypothetical protein